MKKAIDVIIQAEARAFADTFGISGHVRGGRRLAYCQELKDREDKGIGFLLRVISNEERAKLKDFNSDKLKAIEHLTGMPTMQSISRQVLRRYEGTENLRGGRWTPKASFREKVTDSCSHTCYPRRHTSDW